MSNIKPLGSSRTIDWAILARAFEDAPNEKQLMQLIVNEPFKQTVATTLLFLGFMTLLVVNEKTQMIDRVALTNNELANNTLEVTAVPFEKIKIPIDNQENIIAQSIRDGKPRDTTDWFYTFTPALTGNQARINQASAGIAYTAVYPLSVPKGIVLSFSYYQYAHAIGSKQQKFMEKYSALVSKYFS